MPVKDGVGLAFLVAIILFTFGIKRLGRVKTARGANALASLAMLIAIVGAFATGMFGETAFYFDLRFLIGGAVAGGLIGLIAARTVPMTSMPEMVALFNGSGGAASFLVGLAALYGWALHGEGDVAGRYGEVLTAAILQPDLLEAAAHVEPGAKLPRAVTTAQGHGTAIALVLSLLIGGVTLSGSIVAWGKLAGKVFPGHAVQYPGQHPLNGLLILTALGLGGFLVFAAEGTGVITWTAVGLTALALVLGILLVIPIGGADMPVVISLLNSYSGLAASMTGFVLQNTLLIVAGAMVGAAGLILTAIMCKAMNRSLLSVLMGGFGATSTATGGEGARDYKNVKSTTGEELAMMLDGVSSVIFVPGYGLAVAQAQHLCRELAETLEANDVAVKYAIHPVAGRMPGHMNVLLAEANVPYEQLVEMDQINPDFKSTDVVIVLGANDVVNPAALDEPDNPLYGMPILNVHEAQTVIVVKRSLSPGYAGVKNPLFERDNALMLFGDAKAALQETLDELKAD